MKKNLISIFAFLLLISPGLLAAQEGLIQKFELAPNDLILHRIARPGTPFDKVGQKFAVLGDESGSFEAWAYPLKLFRNFEFSFLLGNSTRPIRSRDIVRFISVTPEATTLTFTYQSFTAKATFITPVGEAGAFILLDVDSIEPITIVCGFLPELQPMWPAGLGGQYAYWNDERKAYIISESTGKNHGVVGSPAASGISSTPAHMLSDAPNEFKIEVSDPEKVKDRFIPIVIAGGKAPIEGVLETYEKLMGHLEQLYRGNRDHFCSLRESTVQVKTPVRELNLAFEWAKVAFDNLVVDNPDLGKGLVAGLGASGTSGRPGFGWFFGGDAYINCFSLLGLGAASTAKDVLLFTQKWQRKDGKMPHELSQAAGYINWWEDYHFGFIHGDTTPFYIAAAYEYVKTTGDADFVRTSWESLKRAYEWCLSTDVNQDGLMDNKKAGLGALEYGKLTGIETDVYLAAVWTRATCAMQHLAKIIGEKDYAKMASAHFLKAKKSFDQKFWDEKSGFYTHAFDDEGNRVKEVSPWNAVGMMWDFGTPERSLRSLERLCSSDLFTDWGIRTISDKSKYFKPLGYNYGAVWPFVTGWVTTALYKHHKPIPAYNLLLSTAHHTFDHALGYISEVFSGTHNVPLQESVPHQGFSSAGFVLPFVSGLLGIEGNAQEKTLTFSPQLPADWDRVTIKNFHIGEATFFIDYKRSNDKVSVEIFAENFDGYSVEFVPALEPRTRIKSLLINGHPSNIQVSEGEEETYFVVEIPLRESPVLIEIEHIPFVEILPFPVETKTGDRNKGLKIISIKKKGNTLRIRTEGLAGEEYGLRVTNPELILDVKGADKEKNVLRFRMPGEIKRIFVTHEIELHLGNSDKNS